MGDNAEIEKQMQGAMCLGVSYDTAKHLSGYTGNKDFAPCPVIDGLQSDDPNFYESHAKMKTTFNYIREACPNVKYTVSDDGGFIVESVDGTPPSALCKATLETFWDSGTINNSDAAAVGRSSDQYSQKSYGAVAAGSGEAVNEINKETSCKFAQTWFTEACGEDHSSGCTFNLFTGQQPAEEVVTLMRGLQGKDLLNTIRLWAEKDGERTTLEETKSDDPSNILQKGCPEGSPPDYRPRLISEPPVTRQQDTLWNDILNDYLIPSAPYILPTGAATMITANWLQDQQNRLVAQDRLRDAVTLGVGLWMANGGPVVDAGGGDDDLPPDAPDPSAPGASGLGPPIPTGGATGGDGPDAMAFDWTNGGDPNRFVDWSPTQRQCGDGNSRLDDGDDNPCNPIYNRAAAANAEQPEGSTPDSTNVMDELRNLGACQAVLPLREGIAAALCNNSETQCMAMIDDYFATTDIDEILGDGETDRTQAKDVVKNNCKTFYLDYDFGDDGSSREEKITNLKRVAKSFCMSPGSGSGFVNNGSCLPQCQQSLDGTEAQCTANGAFVGVGYKTIDNPFTSDVDEQRVVFTNCCVDNADAPGADQDNCIRVDEQLRSNAYVALSGDTGGYPGYLEQTIAADSSLRRALQETPSASDYSSDSSQEFTGDGRRGGGGGGTGGGTRGTDMGFGQWMGLSGSAQLNETVLCLNNLFQFMRDYVVPTINDNAELRELPNLAMLINPGYGVLPDDLPRPRVSAFTELTDFAAQVIAGLGGETTDWQRIANYARMATTLRNFLLSHIDRAGVYLERLSTIQECLSGLAGGVAGARRYDSQIFMDLMDSIIERYRYINPPGMDPTTYTPIVPWAALFGADPTDLGDFTNTLLEGNTEIDVGGHVVGYTTDYGTIDADDIANEPYLFGNYLLRRIQNCHRLVLAWRTQLARYLDYVNRQMENEIPDGPQPEPEGDSGDEGGAGGGGIGPIANTAKNALEAGAMNVGQAAELLASASTGIAPTVTMDQALQDGTGGISITSTGPITAPEVRTIPADSNVVSIPIPEPEPEPQSVQARSGVTVDVTSEDATLGLDTTVNIPASNYDGTPLLDEDGNRVTYHPFRDGIRPESVTITVGGAAPVLDSSTSSSSTETEAGAAADAQRTPVNWDTAFQRLTSPPLIPRNDAVTVQPAGPDATPPPIRPVPMARDAPASDRRADVGLGPSRATDTPLAGRTASDLASSPTLMDSTNALRAAVGLEPLPAGAWNRHLPPQPASTTPAGGSTAPPGVPQTDPPAIGPGGDAGTEGDSEEGTTTPGTRPATGTQGDTGADADTDTPGTSGGYVHSREVQRQMRRRDDGLRRRLTTVNYYNNAEQCTMCTDANSGKSNQWVQDVRNDLYSIPGSGDTGFACNPAEPSEDETGPIIACYDIYAGESSGRGTFGVRLPNVRTFNECRKRGGFAIMEDLESGGYAPPIESYSITYEIPHCGNFDIDSDTDNRVRCSDIPDKDTCEKSYYSYKPTGGDFNTYRCVWDNQGNPSSSLANPGDAGSGACSRYVGESTLFSVDGDQVPNKETMDLLVNRCQWRLGDYTNDDKRADGTDWPQKTCHDYVISLCDNVEDKQSCIKDSICRGFDPSTGELTPVGDQLARGGPLVGTRGNWEVSSEMAEACGPSIPGRFGSRPDPDPGEPLYLSSMPGNAAVLSFPQAVNAICEKNDVDSTGIWDKSYLAPCGPNPGQAACDPGKAPGTLTFNPNFFDNPRQGSPGYYCNYPNVTTQLPDNNCDANMGVWRDEREKRQECQTRYTQDFHQCVYDSGFLYGDCNKGPPCAGGQNSSDYDCPSYGEEQCILYSDHCDWTPPVTTRSPSVPFRNVGDGTQDRPTGDLDVVTTPGSCANKE